jgi:hypothetical protein
VITRSPRTYYNDGIRGDIGLNYNDRYTLDGQRLITTSGDYGHSNTTYQTEYDIFTRVKSLDNIGNGPAKFRAETKSGLIYEYGYTQGSRQRVTGYTEILSWYVSKITDLSGNEINFAYMQKRICISCRNKLWH